MSSNPLHNSLLRPPVLHILRASGFHATRPGALDTLVDLMFRYMMRLAENTASHAFLNHNDLIPTITDVRMALEDVGAFRPQIGPMEEQTLGTEDVRGTNAFLDWIRGETNREIRRIAGLTAGEAEAVDIEIGTEREDFLTVLKKKHSKTGEESRFQGTALGRDADEKPVKIEGSDIESVRSWEFRMRQTPQIVKSKAVRKLSSAHASGVSSPLSEP